MDSMTTSHSLRTSAFAAFFAVFAAPAEAQPTEAPTRALTTSSRAFLADPPDGFAPHRLLSPRGFLMVGTAEQENALRAGLTRRIP